jgi:hypothetical protein
VIGNGLRLTMTVLKLLRNSGINSLRGCDVQEVTCRVIQHCVVIRGALLGIIQTCQEPRAAPASRVLGTDVDKTSCRA